VDNLNPSFFICQQTNYIFIFLFFIFLNFFFLKSFHIDKMNNYSSNLSYYDYYYYFMINMMLSYQLPRVKLLRF
jgi:hypothetical protein